MHNLKDLLLLKVHQENTPELSMRMSNKQNVLNIKIKLCTFCNHIQKCICNECLTEFLTKTYLKQYCSKMKLNRPPMVEYLDNMPRV